MAKPFVSPDVIRADFARSMSEMYRAEVPLYGTLIDLVAAINAEHLAQRPGLRAALEASGDLDRVSEERHGAIRVGTASELSMLRRLFAVMGMYPVSYYDLSVAGIPVHSTAFRPVDEAALKANPFRVFTSLLRLELIEDVALRTAAEEALAARDIFTPRARALVAEAEAKGGLGPKEAERFVAEAVETFRWHATATVPVETYGALSAEHRLIADVVSFRGPHINHLTPRTLDIDAVQAAMPDRGIDPKETIEGPPARAVPILLRQTSFKALEEEIGFPDAEGRVTPGTHTARFGEIEARGIALTRKGRALYDRLLVQAMAARKDRGAVGFKAAFADFPDDPTTLRAEGLAYFDYRATDKGRREGPPEEDLEALIAKGCVAAYPIVYEDFLPVSAAGIFQSNLGDSAAGEAYAAPSKARFEAALGAEVYDEFALYGAAEARSIERCRADLGQALGVA
ncbi:MAG: VOC family protein [Pseudomonadota bacterium]